MPDVSACKGLAAIALGMSALTACGSEPNETSPAPSDTSPSTSRTNTTTPGAPPGAKVLGTPRKGQPFTLTTTYTDTPEPTKLQITVTSVTCGKPLDKSVLAYAASSIGTSTPTPKPESGKQYCVVVLDTVNIGNREIIWDTTDTVSLNVGATRYTQSQDDANHAGDYGQYLASKGRTGPSFGLNPGSKGPAPGVFQIPAGSTPSTLWVTSGTAIETIDGIEPGYLVKLS
ncbi:hypothetical protein BJY14_007840 [Actinomadura luteofluorescens]|uniref:DUF4352 domain-containing protein n=2 Tax=Actinomadura luteofluorescens TaxID=46163 RepID=A0A7Y9EQ48_9ACTN|nr:hypothetical protein [Actinomadura luteofluorescens]NYD51857.1 hypothetical protein [Actinomadura luteofluorescens]